MADDGFNGSTIAFPTGSSVLGPLRSLEYSESGPKVNVTDSADATTTYRTGVPDPQIVATFVGGLPASGCDIGTQGFLSVIWNDATIDGTVATPAKAIVVDRGTSGSMDGEITSTVTFAQGQLDAV